MTNGDRDPFVKVASVPLASTQGAMRLAVAILAAALQASGPMTTQPVVNGPSVAANGHNWRSQVQRDLARYEYHPA